MAMTKDEIKAVCEADDKLQWWAMVLFAELSELIICMENQGENFSIGSMLSLVKAKVEEFPRLVIHRAVEKATPTKDEEVENGE